MGGGGGLKIEILDFLLDLNHNVKNFFEVSPYTHPFQTPEMIRVNLDDERLLNYQPFTMIAYKGDELIAVWFIGIHEVKKLTTFKVISIDGGPVLKAPQHAPYIRNLLSETINFARDKNVKFIFIRNDFVYGKELMEPACSLGFHVLSRYASVIDLSQPKEVLWSSLPKSK
jgi:hypothetical protein